MRLLLIEDDKALGKAIHTGLRQEDAADWFQCAEDGAEALKSNAYDVIILDINLPKMSGLEWLAQLRREKCQIPVLLLTARDTVSQRVEGLDAGADDYLIKPFDFGELLARVRALGRRKSPLAEQVILHHALRMNVSAKTIEYEGKPVSLSQKEFSILQYLLEHTGRCHSKEQIEAQLYGWDEEVGSNTVEVHVSSIRRKLRKELIKTIRGAGYMIERAA